MGKVQIEKSKDNFNILKINKDNKNCYLGSKYSQSRELDKFMKSVEPLTEKDNYIVLGAGALEHIKLLLDKKDKKSKILVVEAIDYILEEVKKLEIYNELIKNEDIVITNSIDEIKEFMNENIDDLNLEYAKLVTFSNYNKIFTNELMESYKEIKEHLINMALERNTKLQFKDEWVDSSLINSKYLFESEKINEFKDKYKDTPAIIVSAGPSLQKNINYIDKNKALIISGGRTLKPLLGVNIDPDFMAIIDGSQASYELVENYLDKTNTNLIYNEMTNSKILDNYKGPKISSAQSGFMKEILGEDIVDIIKGGSVANAMTFIAAFMGCNPIIFVGQDLAYTDNKGHAECAKTESVSIDAKENYYKSNDVYVEGIDGKEVRTSLSLKAYKESLEDIVESFKDIKFINATEGGAAIKGTEVRKLKEVLEEFEDIKEKDTKIKNISDKEILKKTIDGLKDNLVASNKVISLTSKAMKSLERFKKAYFKNDNSSVNRINQELNRYEKEINEEIPKLSIVNSVIYDLSYNIECSEQFVVNKSDSKKRVVEKKLDLNTEIYKGMNRICKDSIKKIEDTLNIMEKKYAKLS